VSSVRYFEFDFVRSCLPVAPGRCLDVSSPQLFSLFAAERTSAQVMAWNPDPADIGATAAIASALSVDRLETAVAGVDRLAEDPGGYDCIWSISVIEHIAGDYDDSDAIRWMYDALAPDGRLMLTVPVAREYGHEFHDRDYSGTQPRDEDHGYFFSRHYDRAAVWERLLAPIGREPSRVAWYGETTPGLWRNYQDRWAREGVPATVDDPRLLASGFRSYSSWEQMPGVGVCGLLIDKK
jgi:SAM-dependent methyltransferase